MPAEEMGIGPAVAVPKVLKQAGLKTKDIDVFEINEAFASQAIYSLRVIGIEDRLKAATSTPMAAPSPWGTP